MANVMMVAMAMATSSLHILLVQRVYALLLELLRVGSVAHRKRCRIDAIASAAAAAAFAIFCKAHALLGLFLLRFYVRRCDEIRSIL
jgi:hypothetical protein